MNPTEYRWAVQEVNVRTGERRRVFVFNEAGYREITSFNAFFHGLKEKNRNGNLLYSVTFTGAFERIKGFKCWETEVEKIILSGKAIVCSSLYDFYAKIGYNRKTRSYASA